MTGQGIFFDGCDLQAAGGCVLHNGAFCGRLPQECRRKLASIARLRRYPRGATVSGQGERGDVVGNVVEGVLSLRRAQADGGEQIVGLLLPTDFFGSLFSGHDAFSLEAATDVTVCLYDRRRFEALLRQFPELEHEVLMKVLHELDGAREWIALLGRRTVGERFACFLVMLCRRWPFLGCGLARDRQTLEVTVPIRRADLATCLGTTPETISRTAQAMAKAGILRVITPARFEILDLGRLVDLAGESEIDHSTILEALREAG